MQAHRMKAIVAKNGSLTIESLPFPAGESVEVLVFSANDPKPQENRYPLRGTPIQLDSPTQPVADQNWEMLS